MRRSLEPRLLAAIDVGANAVRLELARPRPGGALETVHQERDPVRPGEGVFRTGRIAPQVAVRLLSTLRRYAALCRRHDAVVRAVATSALREAQNRDAIVRQARESAGLLLEVVSGKEEARLFCLGVLHGKPPGARSLCIDIGGGSTEVASAVGERAEDLWSVSLGAVRLAELFDAGGNVSRKQLRLMREYAAETFREALPARIPGAPRTALGSSGTIRAVVAFASEGAHTHVTQLSRAVEELAEMDYAERARRFDPRRAETIVAGAVVLEALAKHLRLQAVTAVDRGLRHGVLVDLLRRYDVRARERSLLEVAAGVGRRFAFDEAHGRHVAKLAMALFDGLHGVHLLKPSARAYLEVAAMLHDAGQVVSYDKHHRHSAYLIAGVDLPGLSDREKDLVSRIARYHRRAQPSPEHAGMEGLSAGEVRLVRRLSTLLRVAEALDRSHLQLVRGLRVEVGAGRVTLRLSTRGHVDLELWDLSREVDLFRRVFGRRLHAVAGAARL